MTKISVREMSAPNAYFIFSLCHIKVSDKKKKCFYYESRYKMFDFFVY